MSHAKKKSKIMYVFPILLILLGCLVAYYPFLSNRLVERRMSLANNDYIETVDQTDPNEFDEILENAKKYNESLNSATITQTDPFQVVSETQLDEEKEAEYQKNLRFDETGIMGSIEIPSIDVNLPIYHGTSAEVLQFGAGHLRGTSLPIGGSSTHSVISAHTGMSHAKLFTDLTALVVGNHFFLHVGHDTLAYEVSEINIVLPEETESLAIRPGEDIVTLVTCTPYGVNTHRLLVTGKRIEYEEEMQTQETKVASSESRWMENWVRGLKHGAIIGLGLIFIILILNKLIGVFMRHENH